MTDDELGSSDRRRVLAALGGTVGVGLAGCTDDLNLDEETTVPGDGQADEEAEPDDVTDASGGGQTDDSDTETDTTEEEATSEPEDDREPEASFDFGVKRNPFSSTHREFETFRIAFQGVELRPSDGDPVRVEAGGPEFDMTELSTEDPMDVFEADVPPGTYTELAVHLSVVEATHADRGSAAVEGSNPDVLGLGTDGYEVDSNSSVTFNLLLAITQTDTAWSYEIGYESYE